MPAPLPPTDRPRPAHAAHAIAPVDAPLSADRLSIERRGDAIVVRVRSEGCGADRLPDAVFSFRCGDPQYAYWADRLAADEPDRRPPPAARS